MKHFAEIYKDAFIKNWDKDAIADYGTKGSYTYGEFAAQIAKLHTIFDITSIQKGDKIAVLGKNTTSWIITYFAAITKGTVIVPILDEFNPKDVVHILNHSEAKLFFCDKWFNDKVNIEQIEKLDAIFSLSDFTITQSRLSDEVLSKLSNIDTIFTQKYPNGYSQSDIDYVQVESDDLVSINYTSGTTSLTKGVMLMDKNLAGNITFGTDTLYEHLSRSLVILPIAHVYGLLFSVLAQIAGGGKVTFLAKIPSPAILLEACKEVRPTILTLVPLIFEKIYKMKLKPMLEKPMLKFLCKLPFMKSVIYHKVGKQLHKSLGGEGLYEVIIGGAAINKDVEQFLKDIRFPFLVGYGMTECAPLISYIDHKDFEVQSVGKELGMPRASIRIVKENPTDEVGEVQIFGDHVMKGYFKDEEATKNTFTEDGWLKSGDLGYIDQKGNLYLKGRSKTMLLGPSGENIYPEAIESKLLNLPFVSECIVMQNSANKLVAFVYPDYPMIEQAGVSHDRLDRLMANNRRTLNDELAKYENIQRIVIIKEPLPKTPKNTVKRYGLEYLLGEFEQNREKQLVKSRKELADRKEEEKRLKKENSKKKKEKPKKEKKVKTEKVKKEKSSTSPKKEKSK